MPDSSDSPAKRALGEVVRKGFSREINSGRKRVLSTMNDPKTEALMSRYLDALAT